MKKLTTLCWSFALLGVVMEGTLAAEKPRVAVLQLGHKALESRGSAGAAAQDMFITELVKSGKFTVIERERHDELMREKTCRYLAI